MLHTELIAPIPELLRRHAAARGDKCAYRDAHTSVTYAELEVRTGNLAGHLADLGIAPNETIAIMLPNSVQWVESCFAIARAGAIGVPISYDATETEIAYRLTDPACKAVITTAERGDLLARLKASAPQLRTLIVTERGQCAGEALRYADLVTQPAKSPPRDPASMHETAFILYTSGTTGRAKGVALTVHGMLWVTAACWAPITGLGERDTLLSPLPLFHSYALNLSVLRQRLHHGAVLDQRSGTAPENRRVHLLPRRADDVSLPVAGDARRGCDKISQSKSLRFGRRHHAGDAQS
jgi:long-chain acyl-CoA synthetase